MFLRAEGADLTPNLFSQGCLLSPFRFLLAIDWVMKQTTEGTENGIQWTLWTQLDDLDFPEDLALLSHSRQQMQEKTSSLAAYASQVGLQIHPHKTKILKTNSTSTEPVNLGDNNLEEVETFTYLGSVVNEQGGTDADVETRIEKERVSFITLKNIWRSHLIKRAPKSAYSTRTCCTERKHGEQQKPPPRG